MEYENLALLDAHVQERIIKRLTKVAEKGVFVRGDECDLFEAQFAMYLGVKKFVSLGNCTDSVECALLASNLPVGAKVLMPANTYIATILAVKNAGCVPVFFDISDGSANPDYSVFISNLTDDIAAVIATHFYGNPVLGIQSLADHCSQKKILLIEDCAQCTGAKAQGRHLGTFGDFGCFSFYPTKNLGCWGDGGGLAVKEPSRWECIETIGNYGFDLSRTSQIMARNSRLDELQAAILNEKIEELDRLNEARILNAKTYMEVFDGCPTIRLDNSWTEGSVPHVFPVYIANRDIVKKTLESLGYPTAIHYPIPGYAHPSVGISSENRYTNVDKLANCQLSLPVSAIHKPQDLLQLAKSVLRLAKK